MSESDGERAPTGSLEFDSDFSFPSTLIIIQKKCIRKIHQVG